MNVCQELQRFVLANPGLKLRAIAAGIGLTKREEITNASAQLSQLVKRKRLRVEKPIGDYHGHCFFPTETTAQALPKLTPEEAAERERKRAERKATQRREQRQQRRLTKAQKQAFYAKAPVLPVRATGGHAPLPPPPRCARPADRVETVEEFQARGGRIQQLGPFETSTPLRFDHSHGTALKRPHRRARVAVSQ